MHKMFGYTFAEKDATTSNIFDLAQGLMNQQNWREGQRRRGIISVSLQQIGVRNLTLDEQFYAKFFDESPRNRTIIGIFPFGLMRQIQHLTRSTILLFDGDQLFGEAMHIAPNMFTMKSPTPDPSIYFQKRFSASFRNLQYRHRFKTIMVIKSLLVILFQEEQLNKYLRFQGTAFLRKIAPVQIQLPQKNLTMRVSILSLRHDRIYIREAYITPSGWLWEIYIPNQSCFEQVTGDLILNKEGFLGIAVQWQEKVLLMRSRNINLIYADHYNRNQAFSVELDTIPQNGRVKVKRILPGSVFQGELYANDTIAKINETHIAMPDMFAMRLLYGGLDEAFRVFIYRDGRSDKRMTTRPVKLN